MKIDGFLKVFDLLDIGLWQYDSLSSSFSFDQKFSEIFLYTDYLDLLKKKIIEEVPKKSFRIKMEFENGDRYFDCSCHFEHDVYHGTLKEVTTSVEKQKELEELAFFDTLTGLRNRTSCLSYLDKLENKKGFYLYIDIHKFKTINDTFGHRLGDEVLVKFSDILVSKFSNIGEIFRLSGDEFFIHAKVSKFPVVKKALRESSEAFKNLDIPGLVNLKFNVGIVKYKQNEDVSSILQKSDLAMYVAKHSRDMEYVLADNQVMGKFIEEVEYNIRMNKILNFCNSGEEEVVVRRTTDNSVVNSLVNSIYKNN